MPATPSSLEERIRAYYLATTEPGYLTAWAGEALGFHFGLADDDTPSHNESLLNANRYLAARAGVGPGARVLDAGCGVGGSALWLARERGARVTGITLSPRQVELARQFAIDRGHAAEVDFHVMSFADTTFPEASFDVVWHIESLCHAADPRAYLDHARRLLRDGGRFACLDLFLGDGGDPAHARAMCDGWVLPALGAMSGLDAVLEAAGFAGVEVEDLTAKTARSAARLRGLAQRRLLEIELRRAAFGDADPVYEGHARAAVGAADGLASGAVRYGYVGATWAPRRGG